MASLRLPWHLVAPLLAALLSLPLSRAQEIPDYLLEDEHVREEFGVNQFTAPSIRKIFEDLRTLRPLPYEELQRAIPEETPQSRTRLALGLGFLLAEAFFAVEAEQFLDLEPIGRALLKHGTVLGAGTKISRHTKSMLEHGALSDWDGLKEELMRTQKDIEKEMVLIRDVDAANLISLGGWLRAVEIGVASSLNPYDPAKASVLQRPEVVEYFSITLNTMEQRSQEDEVVTRIATELPKLQKKVTLPDQEVLTEEQLLELRVMIESLVDITYGHPLLVASGTSRSDVAVESHLPEAPGDTSPQTPDTKPATGGVITGEVGEE